MAIFNCYVSSPEGIDKEVWRFSADCTFNRRIPKPEMVVWFCIVLRFPSDQPAPWLMDAALLMVLGSCIGVLLISGGDPFALPTYAWYFLMHVSKCFKEAFICHSKKRMIAS